ncbi:rhamnogalacturonan acetylesterase [Reichenbachiella ulvae]|uniref:Rhamnogalacturonan acetylesterase n=1 Tax=Reichenbachiella ulvae TaxID=2980104 RepID=A0ABT3CYY7_9BACT|nr:rhamnogalacturonan acetylesterase [Reichenbachiella ulvae]MCV9388837.1 rhamnogalacturonan acetylesterase [Reichenbachiella ulvae]
MMKKIIFFSLMVVALSAFMQKKVPTIFLVADSTVADKPYGDGNPEKGWGQVLPLYLKEGIEVQNHAVNGRSTKSFRDEGRWGKVMEQLQEGDYVIIEFGHNDQKIKDPKRYADPDTAYRANLIRYVKEAQSKGAKAILATPIVRRQFKWGKLVDSHGRYAEVVREVAAELDVPLLDMEKRTRAEVQSWGKKKSKELYLHYPAGLYPIHKENEADNTHLSGTGAFRFCDLAVSELKREVPELEGFFKK